ncbi:hypothetical protein GCM10017667_53510 [Streptomyces filamentosus]|uniref:Uncharacterized protein n=1 Tax=Streptomyces filamentosus TaxID=67294 RepID=A0A919BU15_STRFL|nr:hypothetical protein GCM10017667_53510 [Streptomyces filamentosus]
MSGSGDGTFFWEAMFARGTGAGDRPSIAQPTDIGPGAFAVQHRGHYPAAAIPGSFVSRPRTNPETTRASAI